MWLFGKRGSAQGPGCMGACAWSKNRAIKFIVCSDHCVSGKWLFQTEKVTCKTDLANAPGTA